MTPLLLDSSVVVTAVLEKGLSPAARRAEASMLVPTSLRTLDAIHLVTYLAARKKLPSLRLLSIDARMIDAARTLGIRLVDK